jgi:hypothetical protein
MESHQYCSSPQTKKELFSTATVTIFLIKTAPYSPRWRRVEDYIL